MEPADIDAIGQSWSSVCVPHHFDSSLALRQAFLQGSSGDLTDAIQSSLLLAPIFSPIPSHTWPRELLRGYCAPPSPALLDSSFSIRPPSEGGVVDDEPPPPSPFLLQPPRNYPAACVAFELLHCDHFDDSFDLLLDGERRRPSQSPSTTTTQKNHKMVGGGGGSCVSQAARRIAEKIEALRGLTKNATTANTPSRKISEGKGALESQLLVAPISKSAISIVQPTAGYQGFPLDSVHFASSVVSLDHEIFGLPTDVECRGFLLGREQPPYRCANKMTSAVVVSTTSQVRERPSMVDGTERSRRHAHRDPVEATKKDTSSEEHDVESSTAAVVVPPRPLVALGGRQVAFGFQQQKNVKGLQGHIKLLPKTVQLAVNISYE